MTVAPGYVFDIELAHAGVGPWSAGRHPGVILAATSTTVTLAPMSTSPPRGHERGYGAEIKDGGSAVSTPIFVHCHVLTTIDAERLRKQQPRGRLPKAELGPIKDRVARYLNLTLAP